MKLGVCVCVCYYVTSLRILQCVDNGMYLHCSPLLAVPEQPASYYILNNYSI
jgi:hypothetical protein